MRFALFLAAALGSAAAGLAAAQAPPAANPGSVRVTVRDAAGLPVAGAIVTLTPPTGAPIASTTTDRGDATLDRVRPGSYDARIETAGLEPVVRSNVVRPRRPPRTGSRFDLQIAGIEEQVEVVPEPADVPFTTALTAETNPGASG